jgi:D-apiose dehydrogenase
MQALRFAAFGAGFWSRYQPSGWREAGPCECVAICDPVRVKAEAMAREFGIPAVYDSPGQLLDKERVDFIDVIANVEAHPELVQMAAERKIPAVCEKPLAASLNTAEQMVAACRAGGAPLLANENWRWQRPIRELAAVLSSGTVGTVFRARIEMVSGFPVFKNQPFLD